MKNVLIALLLMVAFFSKHSLHAQNLKTYSPLLNALSKTERLQFLATLRGLTQSTQVGNQLQQDIFSDLKNGLPVTNPTAGIDSILQAWSAGRMELSALLQQNSDEFKMKDIEAILGAYDQANAGWLKNLGAMPMQNQQSSSCINCRAWACVEEFSRKHAHAPHSLAIRHTT